MAPFMLALAFFLAQTLAAPGIETSTPTPDNVCELPLEQGRCDAIKTRFAFDKVKGGCVSFAYGGCGGNANNFASLADCQAACHSKTATEAAKVKSQVTEKVSEDTTDALQSDQPATVEGASAKCGACPDEVYLTHYQELGCKPVYTDNNKCCPSRYECKSRASQRQDMCYHEGKAYPIDTELPEQLTPTCLVHCRCSQTAYDQAPRMDCVSIECPELFHGPLADDNCVRQYKRDKCCSTNTYCAPKDISLKEVSNVARCEYNGNTYIEGQKFFPDEEPCKVCICGAGFNGTLSDDYCHRVKCNLELHYSRYLRQNCVPIYYKDRCCPIDWSCPESFQTASSTLVSTTETTSAIVIKESNNDEDNKCQFGNLRFAVGEDLPKEMAGECVKCNCQVPPVPTCVKNYDGCLRN